MLPFVKCSWTVETAKDVVMPIVEGKKFPYTKAGMAAAKKAAKKHEGSESKMEKKMEYGPKAKAKPKKK
jgi:hypothetical protein